jgi:glycine/D-amino acid oxidase-like deaminating enzyme/nitrite reductase/ring-hydroxylating ferredoxin subunit
VTVSSEASLWLQTNEPSEFSALDRDQDVDVAVLGAGITGLTTALLLKRDGARVAVIEAARVGSGVTGCTTAKASALQQTIYQQLRSRHGRDGAAAYAEASAAGVDLLAALVRKERIECDLERRPAATYAATEEDRSTVEDEQRAAEEAGLPVRFAEQIDLPFATHGAVCLDDQVQIHPVRYVQGLAGAVHGDGSFVAEQTRAMRVETGDPCKVDTVHGTVTAQQVVVATHYPLLDRGLFFARLEPQRSYCVAARIGGAPPASMSISAGSPTRSIRSYGDLLIVGGEGHTTGARSATPERYERLEEFARRHWDLREVSHRWSAQDPVSWDQLPVIGRYHPGSTRLFVASGFHKWGITSGTFAARILSDLIAGRDHPWAKRFDPSRVGVRGLPRLAQVNAKVAFDFFADRAIPPAKSSASSVSPGEGRIVRDGLGRTGIYRDVAGNAHAVSVRCTHLGCLLRFNAAEQSWDCPCHGSRFGPDGEVLEGPATEPLERKAG